MSCRPHRQSLLALIADIVGIGNTIQCAISASARSTQSEMVTIGLTTLLSHGAELVSRQPPTFRVGKVAVGLISTASLLLMETVQRMPDVLPLLHPEVL